MCPDGCRNTGYIFSPIGGFVQQKIAQKMLLR
jgi:hypothetical protein